MKKTVFRELVTLVFLSLIFISCTPLFNSSDETTEIDGSSTTSARVIESYNDLPAASMSNKGQLYYVIDDSNFYYSDGSRWKQIDLSGPAGPTGPAGEIGPAGPVGPTGESSSGMIKVYDANNVELGYGSGNGFSLQIFSPKGYYYNLGWNGVVPDYVSYYTGLNGTGMMFMPYIQPLNAKTVVRIGSKYYTFRDFDVYGNTVFDSTITSYSSTYSSGIFSNYTPAQNISNITYPYVYKEISIEDAGIPSTIALPITIKYL